VKTLASTLIACPTAGGNKRHDVTLREDGRVVCACADARERGASLVGRLLLGLPPIDGARGCAALAALVEGASGLVRLARGTHRPKYGAWEELVFAYSANPVYRAALDLAERARPERAELRSLVLANVERAGYRHGLGKRNFRSSMRALWDVPVDDQLDMFVVSNFNDDPWNVPYQANWKKDVFDEGLAVVDGRFVCGRSPEDPSILYAITRHEHDDAHWVRTHRLCRGKRLEEVTL